MLNYCLQLCISNSYVRDTQLSHICIKKLLHVCLYVCSYVTVTTKITASLLCLFFRTWLRWRPTFSKSLVKCTLRLWPSNTWMTRTSSSFGSRSNWCPSCPTYPHLSSPASAPRTSPASFIRPCEFTGLTALSYLHTNNTECCSKCYYFVSILQSAVLKLSADTWDSWILIQCTIKTSMNTSSIPSCCNTTLLVREVIVIVWRSKHAKKEK